MIGKTGVVKVMDFGIARIVESDLTKTGSVMGTPPTCPRSKPAARRWRVHDTVMEDCAGSCLYSWFPTAIIAVGGDHACR